MDRPPNGRPFSMRDQQPDKDREARLRSLVESTEAEVLSYALRRVPSREDAADVVAETFLVAWRRIDQIPRGDEARLWVFGVARNQVANLNRGELRRGRLSNLLRQNLVAASPAPVEPQDEVDSGLLEVLSALPEEDREILTLFAWDDLRPAEIAKVMGLRRATTRSRLHRAKKRLEAQLSRRVPEGAATPSNRPIPEENNV